jgi:allophanate hydrolase
MTETAIDLAAAHRSGSLSPRETIRRSFARIEAAADPAMFIALREEADLVAEAEALGGRDGRDLPLCGVPVAVKDNIDVAGLPTTAACPGFSYMPGKDAAVVARLRAAGALIIGKTNLDQFATGLVGTRSPYGTPRNALRPDLIPGGSSSGSAVAVARGIVPLALGTDTAGSGRVPAGLNNIVGLKPSLGLVPASGVVPACRSLDCVSIFALTASDAFAALKIMAGLDEEDAYSRAMPLGELSAIPSGLRVGVPRREDRHFFGDADAQGYFEEAVQRMGAIGATQSKIDLTVFFDAARLLYHGPWVAERTAAVWDFIERHPETVHPITRTIIAQGVEKSAVDTFRAMYRLRELAREAGKPFRDIDVLMVPTMPGPITLSELESDPIAVPASIGADGRPHGVTLLAPAGRDAELAALASVFHAQTGLPLGALGLQPPPHSLHASGLHHGEVAIAVVGAHLSGLPLNHELKALDARFLEEARTAEIYRLFALETRPEKPGLVRVAPGSGTSIALELWALDFENFGRFVASVPPPLSIGTISLADGRQIKGFLAEAEAVANAQDISSFGGWRAFLSSIAQGQ